MSNTLELEKDEVVDEMTSDLRADNFTVANPPETVNQTTVGTAKPSFVKPVIHVEGGANTVLTPEQVIAVSKLVEEKTRQAVREAVYDSGMEAQVIDKSRVPITDFSKITLDDVYDLSVPIEAKAFMSGDVLAIQLKDTNYEARWVNKNPQNLGDKIAKGFTYITPSDLVSSNAIQTGVDAEGHYCFNDVVAMKIDKATYYRALRAAHERAVSTTDNAGIHKRAASQANGFMSRESGFSSDFASAKAAGKMKFYAPEVEV